MNSQFRQIGDDDKPLWLSFNMNTFIVTTAGSLTNEFFKCVEHPEGITEILYNLFCDKIHSGEIPTFGKPRVMDFTVSQQDKEEYTNAEESATGDGSSQQDSGKPDPGRSRSGKKSGTTPGRDQEGIGAVSIQPPDEQQPNA
ncbi:hypothetical protein NVA38_003635 [Escherichia coli]|nr:hypothetical protein [Escherichia coli]EJE1496836.1 hypothetical protein [Escherichia coli]EJN3583887.1 hypothetical protein [Escherichia coli]EJN3776872.1 hypothetical protein [Escherichia coli]EJN3875504.1 hypothetical protein [Escherichia coli]